MSLNQQSIAILATGDEVVAGDIVNSNTSKIAAQLESRRYVVSTHMSVRDDKEQLVSAIKWLFQSNDIVITIGGLGPTVDDLTMEVASLISEQPLVFQEPIWQDILKQYEQWGKPCASINRKQAQIPASGIPLANHVGTACGTILEFEGKHLIVLPGPPLECLTMFDEYALPYLEKLNIQWGPYRHSWFLLGVGESTIAEKLEPICARDHLNVAFRASFPYLEIKIFTQEKSFHHSEIEDLVKPYLISRKRQIYSDAFLEYYKRNTANIRFIVEDNARWLLDWIPHWSLCDGENAIEVQYHKKDNTVITRINGKVFSRAGEYKDQQKNMRFFGEWLSHSWLSHLDGK